MKAFGIVSRSFFIVPVLLVLSSADLMIHSIDNCLKIVTVSLQGGIGTAPPPGACAP